MTKEFLAEHGLEECSTQFDNELEEYQKLVNSTETVDELEEMEKTRNDLYEVLSKNSGHSMEEIIDMCEHGDKWMKASEAIELGFADGIITKKS